MFHFYSRWKWSISPNRRIGSSNSIWFKTRYICWLFVRQRGLTQCNLSFIIYAKRREGWEHVLSTSFSSNSALFFSRVIWRKSWKKGQKHKNERLTRNDFIDADGVACWAFCPQKDVYDFFSPFVSSFLSSLTLLKSVKAVTSTTYSPTRRIYVRTQREREREREMFCIGFAVYQNEKLLSSSKCPLCILSLTPICPRLVYF